MRVVVAPDKFTGSLTAVEAAEAIDEGAGGGAGRGWPPATTGHNHCRRPDGGTGDGQLRGIGRHRRHRDGRGGRAAPVAGRAARAVNGDHVRRRRADTGRAGPGASGGSYSASAGVRPPTAARGWPVRWACDFSTPTFVTCPRGAPPCACCTRSTWPGCPRFESGSRHPGVFLQSVAISAGRSDARRIESRAPRRSPTRRCARAARARASRRSGSRRRTGRRGARGSSG